VAWAKDVSAVTGDRILQALADMGQQLIVLSDYTLDGQPERFADDEPPGVANPAAR
jgi:hypothetical protein